mmetsp:Transcript_34188/g.76408  ORF Transcript_34188/g.76408 Transcript_34188/m.76408 type:complete len:373 (+) Transcript_34188:151-1269(+)
MAGAVRALPTYGLGLSVFIVLMLISGTLNTLLMKFMVMQKVPLTPGGDAQGFDHPYFQSLLMMLGEFLCLIPYYLSTYHPQHAPHDQAPKSVFAFACLLDWTATTLVNMAYVVIAASVVQMTRGAIVIFTALFSVVLLGRKQYAYHLAGVAMVFFGITLVSLSTLIHGQSSGVDLDYNATNNPKIIGIGLCIAAQLFQAGMLVYEENILGKYSVPPLLVVGMEGTFGVIFGVILLTALNTTGVESTPGAFYQMSHSMPLFMAVLVSIGSIAVFNVSGVTVTQRASAVSRSTIDASRTIIIWVIEISLGWNSFKWLQLAGFLILAVGTMVYNRLIVVDWLEPSGEAQVLIKNKEEKVEKLKDISLAAEAKVAV